MAAAAKELTVLCIKRKRTDDPVNSLVVHNMHSKKTKDKNESDSENLIFRYSGTVDDAQKDTTKHVVKNFQTIYNQIVNHSDKAQKEKDNRREDKRARQKSLRYRITSDKRPEVSGVQDQSSLEEKEIKQLYKIFDVIAEDKSDEVSTDKNQNNASNEERILCNNIEMIREKLNISDKEHLPTEYDFVYDLYLAPKGALVVNDDDLIDIEEYRDEYESIICQNGREDECFDDDDDENDEDNWRNEYPEEDSHSSENEFNHSGSYHGSSDDDNDFVFSRYRQGNTRLQFDPYAAELLEEYHHTVADDFSDEEL